jgi:hypothetical protein
MKLSPGSAGGIPSWPVSQVSNSSRTIARRIRADPHLVAFHAQHRDFDLFTGGGFNDESFALSQLQ